MAKKNDINYDELQKELNRQIGSCDFRKIYLVCGEQDYLRTQNRDKLRDALLGSGDKMNYSYYTGNDFSIREIEDIADTLPFFSERRVIVVENSWLFSKSTTETQHLAEYLEKAPETTFFVFVEASPNVQGMLYKTIKKNGFIMDCITPDKDSLRKWAYKRLTEKGSTVTNSVLDMFLDYAGEDMMNLQSEAVKLTDYCAGKAAITNKDVEAICSRQVKDQVFDLISAIVSRKAASALGIYAGLIKLQTPPQVILSLMIRQYDQLLHIKDFMNRGTTSDTELASRLRLPPFVVKKLKPLAAGYSVQELTDIIDRCLQTDQDYKSGRIQDRLAVEKLIVECLQKKPAGKC